MKKIALLLSVAVGALVFAQSSSLVIQNYSNYDAVGRLLTATPGNPLGPVMTPAPAPPYGTYTIPAGASTQYDSFSTTATAAFPIFTWYVTDHINPSNNGAYAYNDPFISTVMSSVNEWAGLNFWLKDTATGATDSYSLGDPAVYPGFSNSQTGAFSSADWFTITTPSGPTTYLQIY